MSSADISFNQIPDSQRTPGKYFEYDTTGAVNTLPGNPQSLILIAQRTKDGTVAADVPTQIFSDVDAATFFGQGSIAHMMAVAALVANQYVNLSIIALDDDPASVAASGSLVIAGPAAANGAISLAIANQPVNIAVNANDTADVIAAVR